MNGYTDGDDGVCWCGSGDYKPHGFGIACEKWEEVEGEKARSVAAREQWLLGRLETLELDPAAPSFLEVARDARALALDLGGEGVEGLGGLVLLAHEVRSLRLSLQELLLRAIHASAGAQTYQEAGLGSPAGEWQRKLAATEHALAQARARCVELEGGPSVAVSAPGAGLEEVYELKFRELEARARAAEAEANTLRASSAYTLTKGARS